MNTRLFQGVDNIVETATVLAGLMKESPFIVLVGAGMSISADAPPAMAFCREMIKGILESEPAQRFYKKNSWIAASLSGFLNDLEFDGLVSLLKIANPQRYPRLFDAFKYVNASKEYIDLLHICQHTNARAIFSTNFDTAIEASARVASVPIRTFAGIDEFPSGEVPAMPLPLFKIHGGVSCKGDGNHMDIQADMGTIAMELNNSRCKIFREYISKYNLLVLGYGGTDYWDIYPILFNEPTKGIVWIQHSPDNDTTSVMTNWESYALTRIRDHVERLIAFKDDRVQIKAETIALISGIRGALNLGATPEFQKQNLPDSWKMPIKSWVENQGDLILMDLGIIMGVFADTEGAYDAFDAFLKLPKHKMNASMRGLAFILRAVNARKPDANDFTSACLLAKECGDMALLAQAQLEFGLFTGKKGSREEAVALIEQAVQLAKAAGDLRTLGLCYANLGHQFTRLLAYRDADNYYRLAINTFRRSGDIPNLIMTLHNYGEMNAINRATPEGIECALPAYLEALSLAWGRNLGLMYKIEMYSRILVILKLMFPDKRDAIDFLVIQPTLNQSGLAEHLIHWIGEHGYRTAEGFELETWKHDIADVEV
ncbi:MAG TPA: hypothetical protein VK186_20690 [Candidatus Deferrimicrobium sp.]|nr:hypothetical protein [Candidatus Deferrimicrobium sp.]